MAESRHDDQQDEQSENQASKDIEGAANQPNMHNKRLGRLGGGCRGALPGVSRL